MMQELYRSLAAYNRWSNEQVCAACGQLDETEYYRDRRAFFGSLHGTLNHLLLTDRVWLGRFVGAPYSFTSLREEVYPTLATLQAAREFEDARIIDYIESLSPEAIGAELTYTNSAGEAFHQPLWQILSHWFNHQTHHRGQVHQMLSEAAIATPVSDFVVFLRDVPIR